MRATIIHGSLPTDQTGTTGWYAEIREGRKLVVRRGYYASKEAAEDSAQRYMQSYEV